MKALITGTPVQIEGEPAEIAQLVELMSSGAVMVEHVHHWRLELPDEDGVQEGRCWCGQVKAFAPWGETANKNAFAIKDHAVKRAPENAIGAAVGAKVQRPNRPCGCGPMGKHGKNCTLKVVA